MKLTLTSLALAAGMFWNIAYADHSAPNGSVAALVQETDELVREVQYSTLRYQVKQAVFNFSYRVRALADCVRYNGRPMLHDHTEEPGCPSVCSYQLRSVRSSFRSVDRYLYDTSYDYPQVYHVYLEVKEVLYQININGPGPGPQPEPGVLVSCTAVDNDWEEHFGGHVAYGRTINEAQRNALIDCQQSHGSCRIQSCR